MGMKGFMAECLVCGRVRRVRGVCRDCRRVAEAVLDELAAEGQRLEADPGLVEDLELLAGPKPRW